MAKAWTEAEKTSLERDYARYAKEGRLAFLAADMERSLRSIQQMAGKLGLCGPDNFSGRRRWSDSDRAAAPAALASRRRKKVQRQRAALVANFRKHIGLSEKGRG